MLTARPGHGPGRLGRCRTKASSADDEVWLDGEIRVNRADFGLIWNRLGIASMDNTIVVHAVFTRQ